MKRATHAPDGANGRVIFRCPGCEDNHQVTLGVWLWNKSLETPTFTPSLLVQGNQWPREEFPDFYKPQHEQVAPGETTVCHSFVTNGRIEFLADSTHALAGQTVDLPEWAP